MQSRWLTLKDRITSSLWFVPGLMVLGAMLLVWLSTWADELVGRQAPAWLSWIYTGGAKGAEAVLSTIAGSMITVAALVFSIVVVVLTLASSQFGPRILRNFMRDKLNQVVLGTFVSTFLYCLLVLRLIRYDSDAYVPHVAVTVAVGLALCSLVVLIYFIHHIAQRIQAPHIAAAIASDLDGAIERMFPERLGHGEARPAEAIDTPPRHQSAAVSAPRSGYLQAIINEDLMQVATEHRLLLELLPRPGDFVVAGTALARLWTTHGAVDEALQQKLRDAFVIGSERTHTQDIRFVAEQLAEVALRALSPSIHDPFTTVTCIEQFGARLAQLAQRRVPSPYRHDDDGELRLIAAPVTLADLAELMFPRLARQASTHLVVPLRMLQVIATLAPFLVRDDDAAGLRRHAVFIETACRDRFAMAGDREQLQQALAAALAALDSRGRAAVSGATT